MIAEVVGSDLPIPEEYRGIEKEVSALEVRVRRLSIITPEDHDAACQLERQLAAQDSAIVARISPAKSAADRAHQEICDLEKVLRGPLLKSRPLLKQKIGDWRVEQKRLADEGNRQRALAAQRLAEEETLDRAVTLERQGQGEAAAALLSVPAVASPISVAAPRIEARGVAIRENWSAELVDLRLLIAWVAEDIQGRYHFLSANGPALNSEARNRKAGFNVPGVKPVMRRV